MDLPVRRGHDFRYTQVGVVSMFISPLYTFVSEDPVGIPTTKSSRSLPKILHVKIAQESTTLHPGDGTRYDPIKYGFLVRCGVVFIGARSPRICSLSFTERGGVRD